MNEIDRQQPSISIIVPTRDRAHLLPRCIWSVLSQDEPDFELIVVDDGSTDDTESVIKGFADRRLVYVKQAPSGAAVARNRGASRARAPFLTFLDSDDEARENWLSSLLDSFQTHQADVVCCGAIRIHEGHRKPRQELMLPKPMDSSFGDLEGLFLAGTFALRSSVFDALGGYDECLPAGQHTDLARRLAKALPEAQWHVHSIDCPLVTVWVHRGSRIRNDPDAVLQAVKIALERARDPESGISRRQRATYLAIAGVNAARLRDLRQARRFFRRALKTDPWTWRHWLRMVLVLLPPLAVRLWKPTRIRRGTEVQRHL